MPSAEPIGAPTLRSPTCVYFTRSFFVGLSKISGQEASVTHKKRTVGATKLGFLIRVLARKINN
jgi:hypothetical protein